MRRCGVHADRPVVVYDDAAGTSAARCWWLLRHHGHRRTAVLDGGLAAWLAGGAALETGEVAAVEGDVEPVDPVAGRIPGAVNVPTAANLAADGGFKDARALTAVYETAGVVERMGARWRAAGCHRTVGRTGARSPRRVTWATHRRWSRRAQWNPGPRAPRRCSEVAGR